MRRLAFLVLLAACHAPAAAPTFRPVNQASLRQAFDEAGDRPRYLVALSPT